MNAQTTTTEPKERSSVYWFIAVMAIIMINLIVKVQLSDAPQLKGANPTEMLDVIRAVADGHALFGPAIAGRLMMFFQNLGATTIIYQDEIPFPELTGRELDVLRMISQGYNNTEIAQKLVKSPKTVRNHITNIFSKLQVANRAQAIVRARQAGLQCLVCFSFAWLDNTQIIRSDCLKGLPARSACRPRP